MLLVRPERVIGLVWVAIKLVGPVGLVGIVKQIGLPQLLLPIWLVEPARLAGTVCVGVKLLGPEELVELSKVSWARKASRARRASRSYAFL